LDVTNNTLYILLLNQFIPDVIASRFPLIERKKESKKFVAKNITSGFESEIF